MRRISVPSRADSYFRHETEVAAEYDVFIKKLCRVVEITVLNKYPFSESLDILDYTSSM